MIQTGAQDALSNPRRYAMSRSVRRPERLVRRVISDSSGGALCSKRKGERQKFIRRKQAAHLRGSFLLKIISER